MGKEKYGCQHLGQIKEKLEGSNLLGCSQGECEDFCRRYIAGEATEEFAC